MIPGAAEKADVSTNKFSARRPAAAAAFVLVHLENLAREVIPGVKDGGFPYIMVVPSGHSEENHRKTIGKWWFNGI